MHLLLKGDDFINSQEIRYFYRNIVKTGNVYRVKHNNKDYGEFKKLSDALYERDALFFCNFDYDLLVECDLENKYEHMELPPFPVKECMSIKRKGKVKFFLIIKCANFTFKEAKRLSANTIQ